MWNFDLNLKKVKNQAKFWLRIWIASGRPSCGEVIEIKRKTKAVYKRQIWSFRDLDTCFPKSTKDWERVINSSKFDDYSNVNIRQSSWIQHYSNVFSRVNSAVHCRHTHSLYVPFCQSETEARISFVCCRNC